MQVPAILNTIAVMALVACTPATAPEAGAPRTAAKPAIDAAPEKPVDVSPGSPPEAHPLAPESVPKKPEPIPEEMPGAQPSR